MTEEQRAKRVHYHEYETLEGIAEHAERIVALEELTFDCLSVICGWMMALNERMGHDKLDATTVPGREFFRLQCRARDLGVPDV